MALHRGEWVAHLRPCHEKNQSDWLDGLDWEADA